MPVREDPISERFGEYGEIQQPSPDTIQLADVTGITPRGINNEINSVTKPKRFKRTRPFNGLRSSSHDSTTSSIQLRRRLFQGNSALSKLNRVEARQRRVAHVTQRFIQPLKVSASITANHRSQTRTCVR